MLASVDILRSILIATGYLNNPIAQENLDAVINKKLRMLYIQRRVNNGLTTDFCGRDE